MCEKPPLRPRREPQPGRDRGHHGDGLRRALSEAHRRYTRRINFREGWRGHLWQGRFASFAMDERYLLRAARYVELNPVQGKLCRVPWRWRWSSAAAHVAGQDDGLVRVAPLLKRVKDWREYLRQPLEAKEEETWRQHERTGRPVRPAKRGRKPKPQEK